jgi:SulP family sulfate permease
MNWVRFFPFFDLKGYNRKEGSLDVIAALAVTLVSVPQLIAYAVIAGLPPVMGLYAATFPTIVGSLLRSSRHVVTGPSNAVSLLVGGGVAAMAGVDPIQVAIALALLVGLFQLLAAFLKLGAVVDYISNPVVLGYITGAGLLIAIGQLHNLTGTASGKGHVGQKVWGWIQGLSAVSWWAVGLAAGTAAVILLLRRISRSIPGPLVSIVLATVISVLFALPEQGVKVVSDISRVPAGFPPLSIPDMKLMLSLVPLALACTVLSLVESSAVARAIASRTGQQLDASVEFAGQGIANVVAGFCGAYPTSGSLSRSALNEQGGAATRLAGVYSGVMMILVLVLLGPLANHIPIASLAGLLLIVAVDLVDVKRIKTTMKSNHSDKIAFVVTVFGTWALPLDQAIYLGVGISIVLFLQKARLLVVRELAVDCDHRLREIDNHGELDECQRCKSIHILHFEGRLFFGVKGELQATLDRVINDPDIKVLLIRIKRTQGMDVTIAEVFAAAAKRMAEQDRHLLLAGVREDAMAIFEQTNTAEQIGLERIFPSQAKWFAAMGEAVRYARALVCHSESCDGCPLRQYLVKQGRIDEKLP